MHKQINKIDHLSKKCYCTHWHIKITIVSVCCVLFFVYVYLLCVFLDIQSPLRECRSIRLGASGLTCYCAPLVCVSAVMELLAVWRHNKPKPKPKGRESLGKKESYGWVFHQKKTERNKRNCLYMNRYRFVTQRYASIPALSVTLPCQEGRLPWYLRNIKVWWLWSECVSTPLYVHVTHS